MRKSPKPAEKKERENYLKPPEGFEVPDIEEGATFEVVIELTKKKDGLCVTAWDGIEVKEGDETEVEEEEVESIGAGAARAAKGVY